MFLRVGGKEYPVVAAYYSGVSLRPRYSLSVGDKILAGGKWRTVKTQAAIRRFYELHGVELWSDWQWVTPTVSWLEDWFMPRLTSLLSR